MKVYVVYRAKDRDTEVKLSERVNAKGNCKRGGTAENKLVKPINDP